MMMVQITARLTTESKALLENYSLEVRLDASELMKLLIIRELRLKRLETLKNGSVRRSRRPKGTGVKLPTVTTRMLAQDVEHFDHYIKCCGLRRGEAATWILETEIAEKWLLTALHQVFL